MLAENIKTVEKNIKEACARANRSDAGKYTANQMIY